MCGCSRPVNPLSLYKKPMPTPTPTPTPTRQGQLERVRPGEGGGVLGTAGQQAAAVLLSDDSFDAMIDYGGSVLVGGWGPGDGPLCGWE